ncbi:MAG TPA: ABC transporter substrate-binding protein [Candidatus Limnocylindrales bacterium]|nr:ABC transporter substrate-binding protein [Candidatus Limnocylindrales bacterium]
MKHSWRVFPMVTVLVLLLAACGTGGTDTTPTPEPPASEPATSESAAASEPAVADDCGAEALGGPIAVDFQLQWVPQAQFAGYFAAKDLGLYEAAGLDVTFLDGGPTIAPQQVVAAADGPEFGEGWVPKVLVAREEGADLVNIAQVFQRSGTLEVSWADSGITEPADWAGKKIGAWGFGNEFEVLAAARQAGLADGDYERVTQDFNMELLLNREVDAAEAMIYNELAQLLETENPETGELYTLDDLNIIDFNEVGSAMLQDHIMARESWLADDTDGTPNEDIAVCFLRASFEGWMHCRDNPDECVDIVLNQGTILGEGHQHWMMNEINALIWPSPDGIGVLDPDLWQQTVDISLEFDILTAEPSDGAFRTDLAEAALEGLDGDTTGDDFEKAEVEVTPGGE